ncbi:MAG: trypsin-like peptidase domain-containing protein [Acidimicrobiia bacterium]
MARDDPTEPIFVDARPEPPKPPARPAPKRVRPPAKKRPGATGSRPAPARAPAVGPAAPAPLRGEADGEPTVAIRPVTARPHRRRRRPPPFMRPGAPGAILMTGILAVIVAFVATFAWAIVDASKPVRAPDSETTPAPSFVPPPTIDPQTSTTRPPEDLTEEEVARRVAATVRPVQTRDEAGQPITGTAFVVGSFGGQTLLLTSFEVVRASTRNPGPGITLDGNRQASLWTWEESRDLALLVTGGSIESLPWATIAPEPGDKVWAGGAGQRMSAGVVLAVNDGGIEHNIFIDDVRRGAPLINERGELLGMTSLAYNPGGRGTDTLYTAIAIRSACERVLRCGSGNTTAEGAASTTTAPR